MRSGNDGEVAQLTGTAGWQRIGALTVFARDPLALRDFYVERLGFRAGGVGRQGDEVTTAHASIGDVDLIFRLHLDAPAQQFAFYVEDLEATTEHLRQRGVEVRTDYPGTFDVGGFMDYARERVVADAEGNRIGLRQVDSDWLED